MLSSFSEAAMLKDLFVSKFDANKLYTTIISTRTGHLLELFNIKQIDKLKPEQIMVIMAKYKSNVIRAYNKKTSNKILQRIIDFCYDPNIIYESKLKVGMKDLDWFVRLVENDVCNIYELWKGRFELAPTAKKELLEKYSVRTIKYFRSDFNQKDFAKYTNKNIHLVELMNKPSYELLWEYYKENGGYEMNRKVEVDCYPVDLLITMLDRRELTPNILNMNDKTGLLSVLYKIKANTDWNKDYGLSKVKDQELINYASLVDNNKELLEQYIRNRLGVAENKA